MKMVEMYAESKIRVSDIAWRLSGWFVELTGWSCTQQAGVWLSAREFCSADIVSRLYQASIESNGETYGALGEEGGEMMQSTDSKGDFSHFK